MIHPEEKLYGWGVYGITMPRALESIHPDQRKTSAKIPSATRRKVASKLWCSSGVFRIFIDDFPWNQALLLTFLSTVILASVSVINRTFPIQQVDQLSKPVEIIISMFEEESEKNISPIQEKKRLPQVDDDYSKQEIMAKMAVEEQQHIIITESKEAKQSVNVEKPRNALRTVNKPVKAPRTIASSALLAETEPEYEKITLSPPTSPHYLGKNDNRILQPKRSDVATNFQSKTNNKIADRILHTDRLQRRYESVRSKIEKSENSRQLPATDISAFHRLIEPAEVVSPNTGQSEHRYAFGGKGASHPMQIASLRSNPQVSFQPRKQGENPKLEPQRKIKDFSARSPAQHSLSQQSFLPTRFSTLKKQAPVYDSAPGKGRLSDKRYILAENNRYQSLKHESTNQQFSFQQQNQEEDISLVPPAPTKSFADEHEVPTNSPALLTKTQDFSGEILPNEVDPSKLISLKEFNVCTDPEEEFRLRTQLAVQLDRSFWIQTGRVLLFFKHPESGYTIQIRIYNPYGRIFRDRCELLQLALNSILHRTK
jgi:hypothetical protein